MLKTRLEKCIAIGGSVLLVGGFLMCCSGIRFPFPGAKRSLNGHLSGDFGVTLPTSAVVENAYWVGSRDPEQVFQVQMTPADAVSFTAAMRAAAAARSIAVEATDSGPVRARPLYGAPPWWNNPPLPDPAVLEFPIKQSEMTTNHYVLLYSPTTGKMYVVWGGF